MKARSLLGPRFFMGRGLMLAGVWRMGNPVAMWKEPYLEPCCRSALHRVALAGLAGRPKGLKDDPCLERMQRMGFVVCSEEGRFFMTPAGRQRHAQEILKHGHQAPLKT